MEFRQLEAFVNAAKYKSFSKAADATFLTQPTISTHVSNLENELGVRLLNRSGREISLTPQVIERFRSRYGSRTAVLHSSLTMGQRTDEWRRIRDGGADIIIGTRSAVYAVELLNTRSRAVMSMKNLKEDLDGILEIQTSSIPGYFYLPQVMEEFHELFPRVRFYVEQSDSRLVNENLMNQRGELGFTGYKGNSGLCFEPVFYDEMVLITPDTDVYRIYQNGEAIPVELFINEPFIMREDGSGTRQEMEKALVYGKPVFKNVDVIARMSNPAAIKQVVSRGLGVSIVSEQVIKRTAEQDNIRYFRIRGLEKKRCFYLAHNKGACLSPIAEHFLEFVREKASRELHEDGQL